MPKMNILIIPNEPVEEYERYGQTYAMYPHKYFDFPIFAQIHFLYLGTKGPLRKGKFFYHRVKGGMLNPFTQLKLQRRGKEIIRKKNISVIRAYNPHVEGFHAVRLQQKTGVPAVVSYHNPYDVERQIVKKTLKRLLIAFPIQVFCEWYCNRNAARILCVSTQLKKDLIRRGVPEKKIEVIYNKVELEKYRKRDENKEIQIIRKYNLEGKKIFLFIGRFVEQKNIFTLLAAFKKVYQKNRKTHLLLVSDGPLRSQIEEWISREKLQKAITLTGFQKNEDLPSFLHIATAFVLPSVFEGFGIVLIEAQAAGVPIICSDLPHVRDIVNKENALLFRPKDTATLAKHMILVLKKPELASRLVSNANSTVTKFDWEYRAKEDEKIYVNVWKSA